MDVCPTDLPLPPTLTARESLDAAAAAAAAITAVLYCETAKSVRQQRLYLFQASSTCTTRILLLNDVIESRVAMKNQC